MYKNKIVNTINENTIFRYIKLGEKGKYEKRCLEDEKNTMILSYSESDHTLPHNEIFDFYRKRGKTKATATSFANQIKQFYEKNENIVWITFFNSKLWWGIADSSEVPVKLENGDTSRKMLNGWHSTNIYDKPLTFDNISGALLKTKNFQGTICSISNKSKNKFDIEDYTRRLITGVKLEQLINANESLDSLKKSVSELIKLLHEKDFEYIIDLLFQYSGYKKLTPGAGVEKNLDLDLLMPLTNERAFVQIKSASNQKEYNSYEEIFYEYGDLYQRMFYVVHTSAELTINNNDKPIHILDISAISNLVIELGLTNILIKKVC